jgi:uncharacterized membrane protein
MPVVIVAALSLMGFCAALAWCLVKFTGTDALTTYLATSLQLHLGSERITLRSQVLTETRVSLGQYLEQGPGRWIWG